MTARDPVVASGETPAPRTLNTLRGFLLVILVLGMVGVLAELCLLKHTEGFWQPVPIVLLGTGLLAILLRFLRPSRGALWFVRVVMASFVVAGAVGVFLHYRGNVEFELEMYPSLEGWELVWETLTGATPVLAPAAMAQLGLIGLAYGYRHPLMVVENP